MAHRARLTVVNKSIRPYTPLPDFTLQGAIADAIANLCDNVNHAGNWCAGAGITEGCP